MLSKGLLAVGSISVASNLNIHPNRSTFSSDSSGVSSL
jgi:hypothetical protein